MGTFRNTFQTGLFLKGRRKPRGDAFCGLIRKNTSGKTGRKDILPVY
jgi:hypothetical protein